jgi:hypothetical protein
MSTTLIEVRPAKAADAASVASTHDEAWRSAYQGIIPGAELEKLINRRGPQLAQFNCCLQMSDKAMRCWCEPRNTV